MVRGGARRVITRCGERRIMWFRIWEQRFAFIIPSCRNFGVGLVCSRLCGMGIESIEGDNCAINGGFGLPLEEDMC